MYLLWGETQERKGGWTEEERSTEGSLRFSFRHNSMFPISAWPLLTTWDTHTKKKKHCLLFQLSSQSPFIVLHHTGGRWSRALLCILIVRSVSVIMHLVSYLSLLTPQTTLHVSLRNTPPAPPAAHETWGYVLLFFCFISPKHTMFPFIQVHLSKLEHRWKAI